MVARSEYSRAAPADADPYLVLAQVRGLFDVVDRFVAELRVGAQRAGVGARVVVRRVDLEQGRAGPEARAVAGGAFASA